MATETARTQVHYTPSKRLKGSDLEKFVKDRCDQLRRDGQASIGRYGVQAVRTADDWKVLESLPDFEGIVPAIPQVIFDCKVCSQSSFNLSEYRRETRGARRRQLNHMIDRSRYGAVCFFLMHWNARQMKTRSEPPETFAFPVHHNHFFWDAFDSGEIKSIKRDDCMAHAVQVGWNVRSNRETVHRPMLLDAIIELRFRMESLL